MPSCEFRENLIACSRKESGKKVFILAKQRYVVSNAPLCGVLAKFTTSGKATCSVPSNEGRCPLSQYASGDIDSIKVKAKMKELGVTDLPHLPRWF